MRIGINAAPFENGNKAGIASAVENVIIKWSISCPKEIFFLLAKREISLDAPLPANWHIIYPSEKYGRLLLSSNRMVSKASSVFYDKVLLPRRIKKLGLDVYWGTSFFLPRKVKGVKYVSYIYDLALFRFKNIGTLKDRLNHRLKLPAACRRADKILTISRSSAEDIHELLGVRKDKIAISYLGGLDGSTEGKHPYTADMKPELNIMGRFILFISTIEPRKNVLTLIRAFEKYLDKYHEDDLYLVLAGGRGWKCDNIYAAAENSRYKDKIIMPGYISSEEKQYLLENASVFAYPSLYEGFGIPVLEAFDKGLPVITTKVSSLPEVGGSAAFYIDDPLDTAALCRQLRKVLTLSEGELSRTREKMKHQLVRFSWEKNAEEIMRLFKRLCRQERKA